MDKKKLIKLVVSFIPQIVSQRLTSHEKHAVIH